MTVPVAPLPPVTVLGEMDTEATDSGGVTVSPTEPPAPVQPPTLAVRVAVAPLVAELVVTLKFAAVCPAGTVTVEAIWTSGLLPARFTTRPPAGAGAVRVTVPVRPFPPLIVPTERLRPETHAVGAGGLTVTWDDTPGLVQPLAPAVTFAVTLLVPALVVMLKPAEVCPAGMVVVASTC